MHELAEKICDEITVLQIKSGKINQTILKWLEERINCLTLHDSDIQTYESLHKHFGLTKPDWCEHIIEEGNLVQSPVIDLWKY